MNTDFDRNIIHYKLDINSNTPEIKKFTQFVFEILQVKTLEEAKTAMTIKENRDKFDKIKQYFNIKNIEVVYNPNMSYRGLFSWIFSTIIEKEVSVFNKFLNKSVAEKELYKVYFGFQDTQSNINNSDIDNVLNENLPPPIPSPLPAEGPNITPDTVKNIKSPEPNLNLIQEIKKSIDNEIIECSYDGKNYVCDNSKIPLYSDAKTYVQNNSTYFIVIGLLLTTGIVVACNK